MDRRHDRPIADLTTLEQALSDRSTRLGPCPPSRLDRSTLSADEGAVLSRVDRSMPVSEILLLAGLPEAQSLRVLLNLLAKGALVVAGDAAPATRSRPPPPRSPYGDYVFSPRELQEEVDLDLEKKKQILFLFHNKSDISHYRLLGIQPAATPAEVRKAYLDRSKEFHPDTYFRKRLGSYGPKIDEIFQWMKAAHDVLMNEAERRKYEREFRRFDAEEVATIARREIDQIEDERRMRSRRQRLLRAKGFARLTMARELMAGGESALGEGNVKDAMHSFQLAIELDPRLDDARNRLQEARKVAAQKRTDASLEDADRAEQEGNHDRALRLLKSALEADGTNSKVHSAMAAFQLRRGVDLQEARAHAQRALDLGDHSARAHGLLGEILIALGQKKIGRAALKTAAELGDARAKALLNG